MFERIFRALLLPCVLAILVSGSQGFYQDYQEVRSQGHASCPSCRRERPDALVSWYSEPVRRDFRILEPEDNPWPSEQQFQPDPPFYDPYDRAVRSRGSPPFRSLGGPSKREDPFTFQRDINFNLAPAPTSPIRRLDGPALDYQPRHQIPRSMSTSNYMKPNFYNKISRQSDLASPSRYSNYGLSQEEPSFEGFRPLNSYEEANKKPYQAYRTGSYPDRPFDIERPVVQPQPYSIRPNTRMSVGLRSPETEQFFPVRREQPRNPPRMYAPQVNHDLYNHSPAQDVYKMAEDSGRGAAEIVNDSSFRDQTQEQKRQQSERRQREEEQQRVRMVQRMNQGNGGRPSNGRFDANGSDQQEDVIGKRDAVNENANVQVVSKSKVSWNRLTKSSTEVSLPEIAEKVTKPGPDEVTAKSVNA